MKSGYYRIFCLILCWGVCMLPFQTYIYAQQAEPKMKTVVEITDCQAFSKKLQATPAFKGWNTAQMKKFIDPVKAQISKTLDNAKNRFGLDIKAIAGLLSGRVIGELDTGRKMVILYCKPKDSVTIEHNILLSIYFDRQ